MLSVKDLVFNYSNSPAILKDISIDGKLGETIGIVGRSGIGKTTLLNLLCGYQGNYSGTILIDNMTPKVAARHRLIGYVFQTPTLFPWLTAEQNVAMPLDLDSRSKGVENVTVKVTEAMQLAKISHAAELFPSQLSGGMQTRVALARALVYSPRLLLLDEPFSALDDIVKEELYADLQAYLTRTQITTIIITHNISEAIRLSDYIYVLASPQNQDFSKVVHCEEIRFQKPRDIDLLKSEQFHETRKHLMEALR